MPKALVPAPANCSPILLPPPCPLRLCGECSTPRSGTGEAYCKGWIHRRCTTANVSAAVTRPMSFQDSLPRALRRLAFDCIFAELLLESFLELQRVFDVRRTLHQPLVFLGASGYDLLLAVFAACVTTALWNQCPSLLPLLSGHCQQYRRRLRVGGSEVERCDLLVRIRVRPSQYVHFDDISQRSLPAPDGSRPCRG